MSDPALANVDRFGCRLPGHEPESPNGCIACGELDVDKEGWCPRCNEEYGDKPNMNALKPCPFCCSPPVLEHSEETGFYIKCFACGAGGPRGKLQFQYTEEHATAVWNNRSAKSQRKDLAPLA